MRGPGPPAVGPGRGRGADRSAGVGPAVAPGALVRAVRTLACDRDGKEAAVDGPSPEEPDRSGRHLGVARGRLLRAWRAGAEPRAGVGGRVAAEVLAALSNANGSWPWRDARRSAPPTSRPSAAI